MRGVAEIGLAGRDAGRLPRKHVRSGGSNPTCGIGLMFEIPRLRLEKKKSILLQLTGPRSRS